MALRALIALVLPAALPALARAQGSAQVPVAADISTTALAVSQINDVRFGAVVAGVPTALNGRNANAGEFQINGNRNAEIAVTMTLPTELSTGFWTMPIGFPANSGCWRRQPGQNACTFWDPSTVLVERIRNNNSPNDVFFVWIGGTVSPSPTQHTGMYLGQVQLSVVYTGN